ncbi:hypothetical protein A2771_03135 [Candidatus Woesebacteria bacterium RIFCSPHIGHO2_01_FULL_38_26b]|uniref:Cohesin domain-containing protein n=1 Tax=Candidatus Woesebacteria bacterium RIFCSPHIGHO2_01_FULL_38_26b TaxID=1802491 RepID=A0A1F7XY67_9BACT|nr:MAG: hypothetical protein A2771_03135 [Candidatus Woesebacteria bacterium RIFCSPHIGHO2_01_FULL_38_26b]
MPPKLISLNKLKLILLFVIAVALPITISLAVRRQNIEAPAIVGNTTLSIQPTSQSVGLNQTSASNVFVDPVGDGIHAVELVINYNSSILQVTDIKPGPFFTDPAATIGQPVEIIKSIANGQIHYALGFPLGSIYSSTAPKTAAIITLKSIANGCSPLTLFVTSTSGQISTTVSDINAQNVLKAVFNGTINSGSGSCGTPTPTFMPTNTPTVNPSLTPSTRKAGDANNDGRVDLIDYVIWLNHYSQNTNNGANDGDFNLDLKVDLIDYVVWLNNYGK